MQPGRSLKPQLPWKARQWLHRHHLHQLHRKGLMAWKAWMMGIMTRIGCPGEVDSVPKKRGRQLGPRQFVKVAGHSSSPWCVRLQCTAVHQKGWTIFQQRLRASGYSGSSPLWASLGLKNKKQLEGAASCATDARGDSSSCVNAPWPSVFFRDSASRRSERPW